jgi:lysozyme
MQASSKAFGIIKQFETCKLKAYPATKKEEEKGIWTIGWGHTKGVKEGDVCSQEQADIWLEGDVIWAEVSIRTLVTAELNQNQFDALVSFIFNVGEPHFKESTLLIKLNEGDYKTAANEFLKWEYQDGQIVRGLVTRREAEKFLFETLES